jgi:uncharacterized protein (DUF1501 family)
MCEHLSRRAALSAISAAALAPWVHAKAANPAQGRMVWVMLRGAADGLSIVVPHADPRYAQLRSSTAIGVPDGTTNTALALDARFGLHPALAALMPWWQSGEMAFIPSAGLPQPNRSHFDAQYAMEVSLNQAPGEKPGVLNTLAGKLSASDTVALGVGEANPAILNGKTPAKLIPRGQAATRTGALAQAGTNKALHDLYSGDDPISQAFRRGAQSRVQSADEINQEKAARAKAASQTASQPAMQPAMQGMQPGMAGGRSIEQVMAAASNGAPDAVGLALDAQHLATLMKRDPKLRLGFLSAGGWDTHANQGAVQGALANQLSGLSQGLVELRKEFNQPNDVIVVMSEFGRTAAENGTRGTDHGFGNAMWVIGKRVNGGKMHGEWTGLDQLNENRDLPAHHDFRAVLAQIFKPTLGLSDSQLADVLPGGKWDKRLDGLLRG